MTIPNNIRTPYVAAEFDTSRAQQGPALLPFRALLIGQKLAAGSATADTLVRCSSEQQADQLCGRGSMLAAMVKAWLANNRSTELWLGVLADNGAGVQAQRTLTITGPATAAGTLSFWLAGRRVPVAVASGDVQNTIAAAINAAINADTEGAYTSTVATNVVTLTARHKGAAQHGLDARLNYVDGEVTPAGVSVAFASTVTGITNPTLTNLIAAMGDQWFHVIAHPYTDATSLTALETELASRDGATRQIDGVAITSAPGSQGTLSSLGNGRNSKYTVIVGQPGENPVTPSYAFAAAAAAAVALEAAADPARPFQTVPLKGVLPPATVDLFTKFPETNQLLFDGVSTSVCDAGGNISLDRLITTYKTNAAGAPDTAWLDLTTVFTAMYIRFTAVNRIKTRYARHKLANDGIKFAAGQPVVTPKIIKSELVTLFSEWESLALTEGMDQFKRDLVVSRNISDPTRVDILLPPDFVNFLAVGAMSIQFRN